MFEREIEQAELQRDELDNRIQRLNQELVATEDAIRRAEGELHRLTGYIEGLEKISEAHDPNAPEETGTKPSPPKRVANPNRTIIADAALILIREAGKPMKRAELFAALQNGGLHIEGKDPVMVLSTMLWRERDRVARLRGVGYWPADQPYPPAGYDPDAQEPTLL